MKSWNVILGVDVSKLTLDICCAERKLYLKIDNQTKGFNVLKKWCRTNEIDLKETMVVLEHTGGYEYRFMQFCESSSITYCRIPGLEIKNSMGMTRGKSDRADSFRIGQYGEEKIKSLFLQSHLTRTYWHLSNCFPFVNAWSGKKQGMKVR